MPSKIMSEAGRRVNVTRPLTHSLDYGEEGLAMQATQRTCSIDGCTKATIARGLCPRHYGQARHSGTLDAHHLTRTKITTCTLDGCDKPSDGRLCPMHRARLQRIGTTEPRVITPADDAVRFWAKIDRRGPTECWPWGGTMLDVGYGQFYAQGRKHMAHRYAYELVVGPIPDGLTIDHVWARGCTRTDCVNPAHLEPVTQAENLRRSNAASAVNARKERCRLGHEYRTAKDGKRFCPTCRVEWERKRRRPR